MERKTAQLIIVIVYLMIFLAAVGFHSVAYALDKAPGWEFAGWEVGKDLSWVKAAPFPIYDQNWDREPDNEKVLNSWGYGARNVDEIKDLLPEPFFNLLKHPEIWGNIRINETAFPPYHHPAYTAYLEATEKYKGEATLDKDGWLHNYKAGRPFPDVDPEKDKDPLVPVKMAWNYVKKMGYDDRWSEHMIELTGMAGDKKRSYNNEVRMFFDNRLLKDPKPLYQPNPKGLNYMQSYYFIEPHLLRGTIELIYRYLDGNKDDDFWMYIPSLRRVRRLGATNTQDKMPGGIDTIMDTFECFFGNVKQFTWKYLGTKTMLMPVAAKSEMQVGPGIFASGVDQYYQRRKTHCLEATYKHPITHTSITFWVDAETYKACYGITKDMKGREWTLTTFMYGRNKSGVHNMNNQNQIDIQRRHGTAAPNFSYKDCIGIEPSFFDMDKLVVSFGR